MIATLVLLNLGQTSRTRLGSSVLLPLEELAQLLVLASEALLVLGARTLVPIASAEEAHFVAALATLNLGRRAVGVVDWRRAGGHDAVAQVGVGADRCQVQQLVVLLEHAGVGYDTANERGQQLTLARLAANHPRARDSQHVALHDANADRLSHALEAEAVLARKLSEGRLALADRTLLELQALLVGRRTLA